MSELITAVGLVFVIEGLLYTLAPTRLKGMLQMIEQVPDDTLRTGGLIAIGIGVGIVWLARQGIAGS